LISKAQKKKLKNFIFYYSELIDEIETSYSQFCINLAALKPRETISLLPMIVFDMADDWFYPGP